MSIPRLAALACFWFFALSTSLLRAQGPAAAGELETYRARLFGLPEFECVSVYGVGVDIIQPDGDKNRDPKGSKPTVINPLTGLATSSTSVTPLMGGHRIHHIRLERKFTKDREFHAWIQKARAGTVEPRDGVLMLQDATGRTIVQFNFVKAAPIRWKVNIPPKDGPKKFVTETVVLRVQGMEMTY